MIETLVLTDIYQPIQKDLDRFSDALRAELRSKDPFFSSIADHLLQISGKHLRPALTLFGSRLCEDKSDWPIQMAIAIELLHQATLIHDDIIDNSMFRRSQLTLNAKWGMEVSIICGDYLYAKAFSILSKIGGPQFNALFADCARVMCEGELKQVETRKNLAMGEETYTGIISKKTASLFSAACAVGAYAARKPEPVVTSLMTYGHNLGLAFQITDDCLDIIGKSETTGKSTGLDVEKSDVTLPLIFLYQELDPDGRTELEELMKGMSTDNRVLCFEKIRKRAVASGAVEACLERASQYVRAASAKLSQLPDSIYRKSLLDLLDYTLQRVK